MNAYGRYVTIIQASITRHDKTLAKKGHSCQGNIKKIKYGGFATIVYYRLNIYYRY